MAYQPRKQGTHARPYGSPTERRNGVCGRDEQRDGEAGRLVVCLAELRWVVWAWTFKRCVRVEVVPLAWRLQPGFARGSS